MSDKLGEFLSFKNKFGRLRREKTDASGAYFADGKVRHSNDDRSILYLRRNLRTFSSENPWSQQMPLIGFAGLGVLPSSRENILIFDGNNNPSGGRPRDRGYQPRLHSGYNQILRGVEERAPTGINQREAANRRGRESV